MRAFAAFVALLLLMARAQAIEPHERLADPALEARARGLSAQLRCQVCQNQSIDDSNAPLAVDLRRLVRERITAGDSDAQVMDFLVRRYGDYVLLRPPLRFDTALLWFGPALLLAAGAIGLFIARRRRAAEATAPLSADEQQRLAALLAKDRER
jgi:cytochrome c-type biogenesis protein CcmH